MKAQSTALATYQMLNHGNPPYRGSAHGCQEHLELLPAAVAISIPDRGSLARLRSRLARRKQTAQASTTEQKRHTPPAGPCPKHGASMNSSRPPATWLRCYCHVWFPEERVEATEDEATCPSDFTDETQRRRKLQTTQILVLKPPSSLKCK